MNQHETFADNTPIKMYINKSNISITFKIKSRYYLNFLLLNNEINWKH